MELKQIILSIFIVVLLSSIIGVVFAYQEEIKVSAKDIFKSYFQTKLASLDVSQQKKFQDFSSQGPVDKIKQANIFQNKFDSIKEIKSLNNKIKSVDVRSLG